jgi:thiamine biosynthesis protein ThiS
MRRFVVNGKSLEAEAETLSSLLTELGVQAPLILIEYNGIALTRSEWGSVILHDGDRLELLSVAAGG